MTKTVRLTRGYEALVDDADHEAVVDAGPWYAAIDGRTVYAQRGIRRPGGTSTTQRLHAFLTGWPLVDHHDGNGLNNQRANLRPATQAQNGANMRPSSRNTSGFKGVSWHRRDDYWRAYITPTGRQIHLGKFKTAKDAALAYDAAAFLTWGQFALLNFPDELTAERTDAIRKRLTAANPEAA